MKILVLSAVLCFSFQTMARTVSIFYNKNDSTLTLIDNYNINLDSTIYEYISPFNLSVSEIDGKDTVNLFQNPCCCDYTIIDSNNIIIHFWIMNVIEQDQCVCQTEETQEDKCFKNLYGIDCSAYLNANADGNLNISFIAHNNLLKKKKLCKKQKKENLLLEKSTKNAFWSIYFNFCHKTCSFFNRYCGKTIGNKKYFNKLNADVLELENFYKNW